jgi:hypothetical protein
MRGRRRGLRAWILRVGGRGTRPWTLVGGGESGVEPIKYHKDGSVWAKGKVTDGVSTGHWEWDTAVANLCAIPILDVSGLQHCPARRPALP